MKLIVALVLLIGTAKSQDSEPWDGYGFTAEAVIQQLFEMLRNVIRTGSPDKDVPVLDPFNVDGQYSKDIGTFLRANANITNGYICGLGSFRSIHSNFNKEELSMKLKVSFPYLRLQADYYEMGGEIYGAFPLAGKGRLLFQINNMNVYSNIFLKRSEDSIVVDKLENSTFTVESFLSETAFDNNIDGIANAMIEELLADYVNRFYGAIVKLYTEPLLNMLNPFLNKFDTWRFLALISK